MHRSGHFPSSSSSEDRPERLGALATVTMAVENDDTNRRLVDLADLQPGDRALDVGCGPGTAVRHAVRVGRGTATGIDASATAIRVARALSHRALRTGRLRLEVADVTALPYADGASPSPGR